MMGIEKAVKANIDKDQFVSIEIKELEKRPLGTTDNYSKTNKTERWNLYHFCTPREGLRKRTMEGAIWNLKMNMNSIQR